MYEVEIWLEEAAQRQELPARRRPHQGVVAVTTIPTAIPKAITKRIPRRIPKVITKTISWALLKKTHRVGLVSFCLLCLAMSTTWAQEKAQQAMTRGGTRTSAKASSPKAAGAARANHLVGEKSPYLLLHAHNPVDWYPWGEEAFAKARRENKPIFLSVGYYTCHWCHVMERESYSNPEIAKLLNRSFVSIKVDREERPDIDAEYMAFVEESEGHGGWPMNVVLTPQLKPFFGGTYFPPADRSGMPGLKSVLPEIAADWRAKHEEVLHSAETMTTQLRAFEEKATQASVTLDVTVLDHTFQQIQSMYDSTHGGFGGSPKFPRPVTLEFLLHYWRRTGNRDALEMVVHTLRAMASGGVHDQIGGGFHRYATDAEWRVPHFEKMLYDQAQLISVYLEAYQVTREEAFADVARKTLDFALREMQSEEGGFFSALDADSMVFDGPRVPGEGAFYSWRASDVERILGADAMPFEYRYGIERDGNVSGKQDIEGWLKGKNVVFERHTIAEAAGEFHKPEGEISSLLETGRRKLLAARESRPKPPVDSKVITSWNGLMISALAKAYQVLNDRKYLEAANRVTALMEHHLYDTGTGRLKRRYRVGEAAIDGYAEDYAYTVRALLDLYEASFDVHLISWALRLEEVQDRLFWDAKRGGYFSSGADDKNMVWRTHEAYDGVQPSPNSVAVMNLLRLWQITEKEEFRKRAEETLGAFSKQLESAGESMPYLVAAFDFNTSKHRQVVIAGKPGAQDTRELLRLVWMRYMPNGVLLLADGAAEQKQLSKWAPLVATMTLKDGRATAYVCQNYVCNLPSSDPQVVAKILDEDR